MSNTSITKEALANALETLLSQQSLSKISIKNITDYCNISRNTFYYHFKDKYELIHWIFYTDMNAQIPHFLHPDNLPDSFVEMCKVLYKHRKFYFSCFQYTGQNSLYEYIYELFLQLWTKKLEHAEQKYNLCIRREELQLTAKMNTHALLGMMSEWIHDGMHDDYMSYFEQICLILKRENLLFCA